jgi:hypothetical protein
LKYLAQSDRLFLPSLDLAYVFHAITQKIIPTVHGALKELGCSFRLRVMVFVRRRKEVTAGEE